MSSILVVDPNARAVDSLERLLATFGHAVVSVGSADEALSALTWSSSRSRWWSSGSPDSAAWA